MTDIEPASEPLIIEDLDELLRAAFRSPSPDTGPRHPIRSGQEPDLPPIQSGYRILGELARGGMGIILRGRDEELARDVAVKVLREELAGNGAILRRFVDEAQIAGQLQHPGIVPIYALGHASDGRPYFAMKWIRGRTLASLLAERCSPEEDRHRFVSIFEQVCQAIAYAHSRQVVHRDLKPSNVMIGSFGEVQVLDWGLAKVLGRSEVERSSASSSADEGSVETTRSRTRNSAADSMQGAVMGTPAYMPPEQARGEIERVDERSDVFSLGGILCEILTGKAPYSGDSEVARAAATKAEVAEAFGRLDAVGDAPELATLCKRCLAPDPHDRPRSAQVLTQAIGEYRASVEERVRAAQIAAANARVKAAEERRARRLTLALAAAIVVLVVGGVGTRLWVQGLTNARRIAMATRVNAALDRASLAFGQASQTTDPNLWQVALANLELARNTLEGDESDPELERRTQELGALITSGAEAARHRVEREQSNHQLLARLAELHAPEGEGADAPDWSLVDRNYAATFRAEGLDLDAQPSEEIAREIRARGLGLEAAGALDEWAAARRRAGDAEGSARLTRVAVLSETDETRGRLREALSVGDKEQLVEFSKSSQLERLPVATLSLLGNALASAGDDQDAERVLRIAVAQRPDDFVSNVYLARRVWMHDFQESARYYAAALAARPNDPLVVHEYGWVLDHYLNESARAVTLYRSVLDRSPRDATLRVYLGHALMNLLDFDAAIAAYTDALRIEPDRFSARVRRLECRVREQDYDQATKECLELLAEYPQQAQIHFYQAELLMAKGDTWGAIDEYRAAASLAPAQDRLRAVLEVLGDEEGSLRAAREAVAIAPDYLLTYFDLGLELGDLIDLDTAIAQRRDAVLAHPASPTQHALLGVMLREKGLYSESSIELHAADALGRELGHWIAPAEDPFTESKRLIFRERRSVRWADEAERLRLLELRYERVFRGEEQAGSPAEWAEYARLAMRRNRPLPAARMYTKALTGQDPGPVEPVDAASATAAVGLGSDQESAGLEEADRARWRELAARWMRADLRRLATLVESGVVADRLNATRVMGRWSRSPALARLRDPTELGTTDERDMWQTLWSDLDTLARRIQAGSARPVK